jgi:hypothetical protein
MAANGRGLDESPAAVSLRLDTRDIPGLFLVNVRLHSSPKTLGMRISPITASGRILVNLCC